MYIPYRGIYKAMMINSRSAHPRRRRIMDDNTTMMCGELCSLSRMTAAVQSIIAGTLVKFMTVICGSDGGVRWLRLAVGKYRISAPISPTFFAKFGNER